MDNRTVYFREDAYDEPLGNDCQPERHVSCDRKHKPHRKGSGSVEIGPFVKVPRHLFGSGMAALLGPAALGLYVALCDHANRNGSNTFKVSDQALASDTGIAPRTISGLRKKLLENRLVKCAREPGQSSTYTLLAQRFEWKQVRLRPRPKRKPRAFAVLIRRAGVERVESTSISQLANVAREYSKVC